MKIERVNDHQIRCTLTKKELEKRDLKLSDMSYGNEKVKRLFQDMMQMAAYECDFEAEDTPLMIEVIPFTECAVVIITKVEDPDELDTRFSRFAPSVHDGESSLSGLIGDVVQSLAGNGEEIAELFKKMQQHNDKEAPSLAADASVEDAEDSKVTGSIFYEFDSLNETIRACRSVKTAYIGDSILYKNARENRFILYLYNVDSSAEDFAKVCNILSEYAGKVHDNGYYKFYAKEHFDTLIGENAVSSLAEI